MAKGIYGMSFAVSVLVILLVALVVLPWFNTRFPGLTQGFSNYDCKRTTECPEGSFCQNDKCIEINAPVTNGGVVTGAFS